MRRPVDLSLSRLESREVPAAGLFAEVRPGDWGSNPVMHGASGDALYFSANNIYQGTELWVSDGTKAGTRMVKDLNPGKPGSNIWGYTAGNGVFYFQQQKEGTTQFTDYKTDGTAAGTVQIGNGVRRILQDGGIILGGWKGELLYMLPLAATPGGWSLRMTDGVNGRVLTAFDHQPLAAETSSYSHQAFPYAQTGGGDSATFTLPIRLQTGEVQVWQTDGTAAGTGLQQSHLTATSPTTGPVDLMPGVEIAPGKFLFRSLTSTPGPITSLWVGDGTSPDRQLVKAFDGATYLGTFTPTPTVGGKMFFTVTPPTWDASPSADTGVWMTDGTAAGTTKVDMPSLEPSADNRFPTIRGTFDGKVLVQVPTADPNVSAHVLTDGTTLTPVPTPAGTNVNFWLFTGVVPADVANPKGAILFQEANGKIYRTDGTAAGTGLIDTAGMPVQANHWYNWRGEGQFVGLPLPWVAHGVYFKGDVFYPGRPTSAEPRMGYELWKWDLDAATPPPPTTTPPKVTGTKVNDGSAQRSMVKTLTVTFDSAVTVNPTGVTILNARGDTPAFTQQLTTANGITTLTITFPAGVGGSIADGRWTLRIDDAAVKTQAGGTKMAADYSFVFTRVYGDTSGDGIYDRETRLLVKQLLGQEVGDPGYRWDLDVNSDGKIDGADELAAIRNWNKAV